MEASLDVGTHPGVAAPIPGLDTPRFDPVNDDAGEDAILRPVVYGLDALLLFVGLLYVRLEETFPTLTSMRIALGIALVTLLGLWFRLFLNREPVIRTPVNGMIVGFGMVAVLSTLGLGTASMVAPEVCKLVLLVLLIHNLIRTREQYQNMVTTVLVCSGYLALYSIYLYFSGQALQQGELERSQGTGIFGDPNPLG